MTMLDDIETRAGRLGLAPIGLQTFADIIPNFVFVTDASGGNVLTNRRFQSFTGLAADALIGDGWLQVVHPDDRARAAVTWQSALLSSEAYEAEYRFRAHDGEYRWFLCHAAPVMEQGGIVRWVGTCCDIDDRRLAEAALARSEAWFRSTFERSAAGIAHVALDGRFLAVNDRFVAIVGRTHDELCGERFQTITHPDDLAEDEANVAALLAGTIEHYAMEKRYVRPDGSAAATCLTVGLARDTAGAPLHFISVIEPRAAGQRNADARFRALFHPLLNNALRASPSARAAIDGACECLGRALNATLIAFSEVQPDGEHTLCENEWRAGGTASILGRHRLADYGADRIADLLSGKPVCVDDVSADPRTAGSSAEAAYAAIGCRASLDVPLILDGRVRALLSVGFADANRWTPDEIALANETIERIWDVAERARAEDALRRSEAEARARADEIEAIYASTPIGMTVLDRDLRYVRINERLAEMNGVPAADHIGRTLSEVLPDIGEQAEELLQRVLAGEEVLDHEISGTTPAQPGVVRTWLANWLPLRNAAGDIVGITISAEEVTDKRAVEEALRRSEARERALFAAAPTPFLVLEADTPRFTISGANDTYLAATMTTREGLVGRGVFEAFPESVADPADHGVISLRASLERALLTRSPDELPLLKYDIAGPDNGVEERWWRLVNSPVLDAHCEVEAIIHCATDITEQVRSEAALRASEERHRILVSALSEIVWETDAGAQAEPSAAWAALTGMTLDETAGSGWLAAVHPDDLALTRANFSVASATPGRRYITEYRLRCADGVYRWFESRGVPRIGEDGIIAGWTGVSIDIDERRQARTKLQDSEARLRRIFESGMIGVGYGDIDGNIAEINDAFLEMIGRTRAELDAGEINWIEITAPEHRDRDDIAFAQMQRAGVSAPYEKDYVLADGQRLPVQLAMAALDPSSGSRAHVALIADMTVQKQAIAAVAASEAELRARLNALPQIIWSTQPDGFHDFYNDRWYEFTGVAAGSTDGEDWNGMFHADDQDRAWQLWRHSLSSGEPYEIEYRLRHASGGYRWVLGRALPIRGPDGTIVRWMGSCTDINEMVLSRAALAESRRLVEEANAALEQRVTERTTALRRANALLTAEMHKREATQLALMESKKLEALGQLTAGIAHDFNNILAAITGGMSLIEKRVDDQRVLDITRHCQDAAFRAAKLIKQMLAFARQEVLEPVSVDLATLLPELKPLLTQAIPGNIVTIEVASALPKVRIDPVMLETALLNLAVNASDAMPGGGRLTLTAQASCPGEAGHPAELASSETVAIIVQDTGAGMPPEVLQRVIEPFYTTKAPGSGTGLGLAMVHGFIVQSGGALRIASRPGEGTSITLFLPRDTQTDDVVPVAAPSQETTAPGDGAILLVDDDVPVRAIIAHQLRDLGYQVAEAGSHDEALTAIDGGLTFDCVVSDVVMPGGDGIALAARIRERRKDVPILFLTGRAESDRVAGETVLPKPFTAAKLSQAVANIRARAVADEMLLDKIARRCRSQCLTDMLALWRDGRSVGKVPLFAAFNPDLCSEPGSLVVMKADLAQLPPRFEFMAAGDELETLLGRPLQGNELEVRGNDAFGSLEASYGRAARTGLPVYDFLKSNFGDGNSETFELLILPFSSDGRIANRLASIVMFGPTHREAVGGQDALTRTGLRRS